MKNARSLTSLIAGVVALINLTPAFAEPTTASYIFTVPVQIKNLTLGMAPERGREFYVGCGVTSGTSLTIDNSLNVTPTGAPLPGAVYRGWKSAAQSTGQPGTLVGQAFTKIPLDTTESYSGNLTVTVAATDTKGVSQREAASTGHYYLCGLFERNGDKLFALTEAVGSQRADGTLANDGYLFAKNTFAPIAQGAIQ